MTGTLGQLRDVGRLARWRKAPPDGGLAPAVLIVTSRHRLWQRYGADGLTAIERAVGELTNAMAARGLSGTMLYADDSPLATCLGLLPADIRRPEAIAQLLRGVAARLRWTDEQARYVLILGDDGVVPFHRLANPSPDGEEVLLSDHPYATDEADPLTPVRAVGRIPDLGLTHLIDALGAASKAHWALARRRSLPLASEACGYSASVWRGAARAVYEAIGAPQALRLSPPLTHREWTVAGDQGPRLRYFNLHGVPGSPHWFGQRHPSYPGDYPAFPVALRAEEIEPAPGSVVLSEACYGAYIQPRSSSESVALAFLTKGALAFVGATGVAYGGLEGGALCSADLLARRFWEALRRGAPAGEALAHAKRSLLAAALAGAGYLDSEDEKAIYNFVLYGDPSLVHWEVARRQAFASRVDWLEHAWAGPAESVGTRPVRPSHAGASETPPAQAGLAIAWDMAASPADASCSAERSRATDVPAAMVEQVRQYVARRLPEFASSDVQLEAAPLAGPRQPKDIASRARETRGAVVVTLRRHIRMCDGPSCCEIARATVDGSGRVIKLAVTR